MTTVVGPVAGPMTERRIATIGPLSAFSRWAAMLPPADLCLGVAFACAWAMGHTFIGIEGDSRIYMGRALADLDPAGVGRDMMFTMDGQSGFTIYRLLARALAATAGFGATVAILSLINLAAWFAAAVTLARTIVPGRALALVLAAVCVLPRLYTPWNLLAAGEAIAVPRPLAEAGVLLALAALIRGRPLACFVCLVGAALFHPIMAAPGFGVLLIVLGLRDRRWFAAAVVLGAAGIAAGALGLPVASRLTARIDPEWMRLLVDRNPYLFVHLWPAEGAAPFLIQGITIAIGATWLAPRARIVVFASLAAAAIGVLASVIGGDALGSLLIVQAQLWRALWLPAVLGPMLAGVCLLHLPSRGTSGAIALAALLPAWLCGGEPLLQLAAALVAAFAFFAGPRLLPSLGRPGLIAVWGICIVLVLRSQATSLIALEVLTAKLPSGEALPSDIVWPLGLPAIPLVLLAILVWRRPDAAMTRTAAALAAILGIAAVALLWNGRTPAHEDADDARVKPDLVALLAPRPGPVLWVDGDDGWYWARRPNWNGMTQGGGLVFSRDLAQLWRSRADTMLEAGLATRHLLHPWAVKMSLTAPTLDPARIDAFCHRSDAPAWIVASLEPGVAPPASLAARVWSPAHAHLKLMLGETDVRWRRFDRYAVVPCAPALAKTPAG